MRAVQGLNGFLDFLTHLLTIKQLQQDFFAGMPKVSAKSMGNSGSMGTMICCKLAQRASLNMIRRIDLLTEILFVHDRFSQILCETYTIVFGFSASMSTTRHGTFKWTMGVIALATAIHEVEHFILGGLDSCGLLDWLGKSIIVD